MESFFVLMESSATVQTTVSRLSRNGGEHQPRLFKTVPKRGVISITKGCGERSSLCCFQAKWQSLSPTGYGENRSYLPVTDRVAKRPSEAHTGRLTAEACKAVQPVGNGNTEECQSCGSKVLNQRDEFRWSWLREKWLIKQLT